jgi:hypothetical protein
MAGKPKNIHFELLGVTNANRVTHTKMRDPQRGIPRLRKYAQMIINGPSELVITNDKNSIEHSQHVERILHISERRPNELLTAWSLFSISRMFYNTEAEQFDDGLVLRRSRWLTHLDFGEKEVALNSTPNVITEVMYISRKRCAELLAHLMRLDEAIIGGIPLVKRDNERTVVWSEITLMRLFDWGKVDYSWDSSRENSVSETCLLSIMTCIDRLIREEHESQQEHVKLINAMYEMPLEDFTKLLASKPHQVST